MFPVHVAHSVAQTIHEIVGRSGVLLYASELQVHGPFGVGADAFGSSHVMQSPVLGATHVKQSSQHASQVQVLVFP